MTKNEMPFLPIVLKAFLSVLVLPLVAAAGAPAAPAGGSTGDAAASPAGWQLTLGFTARHVGDIHFKHQRVALPGTDSDYVNFAREGTAWQMLDPAVQAPGGYAFAGAYSSAFVRADQAAWRGGDEEAWAVGGTLNLSRVFYRRERLSCALMFSFTVFDLDADDGGRAGPGADRGFDTANTRFTILAPNPPVDPAHATVTPTGDWGPIGGSLGGPAAATAGLSTAAVSVRTDLDATLYELGVGCRLRYRFGRLSLCASTGPLFSLVDMDTDVRRRVETGSVRVVAHDSDSDTELQFGWFARCGLDFLLTPRIVIGAGFRYDYVSGTVGTRDADMDPSGIGADVHIGMRF